MFEPVQNNLINAIEADTEKDYTHSKISLHFSKVASLIKQFSEWRIRHCIYSEILGHIWLSVETYNWNKIWLISVYLPHDADACITAKSEKVDIIIECGANAHHHTMCTGMEKVGIRFINKEFSGILLPKVFWRTPTHFKNWMHLIRS